VRDIFPPLPILPTYAVDIVEKQIKVGPDARSGPSFPGPAGEFDPEAPSLALRGA